MTNLEIIKQLNQLSLRINTLIAALSEQTTVDNNALTFDNIQSSAEEPILLLGSQFQEEESLFADTVIETLAGEAFVEPATETPEVIVDDGEELIFN